MKRTVFAVGAALVSWVLVGSLLNRALRYGMAGYAVAEPVLAFTLGMQLARLAIAVVTSLAAGALAAWIAPTSPQAPWIAGLILLVGFLPVHVQLWQSFPLWYHLSFLVTLVPLVVLGARVQRRRGLAATPAA